MESTKRSSSDSSIKNNNFNNITLNVTQEKSKRQYTKKKSEPNWYIRTILGGIIALILSLGAYYLKKNIDDDSKSGLIEITPGGKTVQPNN